MPKISIETKEYDLILQKILTEVNLTRLVIANRINSSVIRMYWNIGNYLSEKILENGYGRNVVKRLSFDLTEKFPDANGFSPRNLWYMKKFYSFYALNIADNFDISKTATAVALSFAEVLPWGHHRLIMDKVKNREVALEIKTNTAEKN